MPDSTIGTALFSYTDDNNCFRVTVMYNNIPVKVCFDNFDLFNNSIYIIIGDNNLADNAWTNASGAGPRLGRGEQIL
jgi:hypothetical protein